jgi:hypothetical protein
MQQKLLKFTNKFTNNYMSGDPIITAIKVTSGTARQQHFHLEVTLNWKLVASLYVSILTSEEMNFDVRYT